MSDSETSSIASETQPDAASTALAALRQPDDYTRTYSTAGYTKVQWYNKGGALKPWGSIRPKLEPKQGLGKAIKGRRDGKSLQAILQQVHDIEWQAGWTAMDLAAKLPVRMVTWNGKRGAIFLMYLEHLPGLRDMRAAIASGKATVEMGFALQPPGATQAGLAILAQATQAPTPATAAVSPAAPPATPSSSIDAATTQSTVSKSKSTVPQRKSTVLQPESTVLSTRTTVPSGYNAAATATPNVANLAEVFTRCSITQHHQPSNIWHVPKQVQTQCSQEYAAPKVDCGCSDTATACWDPSVCYNLAFQMQCSPNCARGTACQNQGIRRQFVIPHIIHETTNNTGLGVFAKENIEPHTFLMEYTGVVVTKRMYEELTTIYHKAGSNAFYGYAMPCTDEKEVEHVVFIDAAVFGNAARYINHSCEPNAMTLPLSCDGHQSMAIYASKPIRKGEEITIHYNPTNASESLDDPQFVCTCGAPSCKELMTLAVALTPPERQRRAAQASRSEATSSGKAPSTTLFVETPDKPRTLQTAFKTVRRQSKRKSSVTSSDASSAPIKTKKTAAAKPQSRVRSKSTPPTSAPPSPTPSAAEPTAAQPATATPAANTAEKPTPPSGDAPGTITLSPRLLKARVTATPISDSDTEGSVTFVSPQEKVTEPESEYEELEDLPRSRGRGRGRGTPRGRPRSSATGRRGTTTTKRGSKQAGSK